MNARTTTAALLAIAALGVGACGDDDDAATDNRVAPPAATAPATAPAPAPTATATTPADSGTTIEEMELTSDLKKKPEVVKPSGEPPTKLYKRDIVRGKGKRSKTGDNVSVQYVGVSYSNGEQFDASWDRGDPFTFQLGAQMVIAGWDQGVAGMREGGRRLLVIPPDLGYGAAGQGQIAPNETLIFVVDLEKAG